MQFTRTMWAGVAALALGAATGPARAQDMPPILPPPAPQAQPAPAAVTPPAAVAAPPAASPLVPGVQTAAVPASAVSDPPPAAAQPLPAARLDQLVAPVALYPDPLLSQVLMAATYPLEVIEAARWVRVPANRALSGDALTEALKPKNWDPSIMALIAFPRVLSLMADKLEWTEQVGDAFLAQQADVMAAVQRLRHEAMAAGNLKVTPECHCQIQTSGETISILPVKRQVVCVPVYNPTVAYGVWPEPAYPPVVFPVPVGFVAEPGVVIAFAPIVELAAFGPLWGWSWIDWPHHYIGIDTARLAVFHATRPALAGGIWVHDPVHRRAVAYHDLAVTGRFGAARVAAVTAVGRMAFAHPGGGPAAAFGRHNGGAAVGAALPGTGGHEHAGARSFGPGHFGGGPHAFGSSHVAGAPHGMPRGGGPVRAFAPHGGGGMPHFGGAPHGGGPRGGFSPARFGGAPHGGGPGGHGNGGHHH